MDKLKSNHAVYMVGLLISLIGSILLGNAIAGDLLSHIDPSHGLLDAIHFIQLNHIVMFAVGGILMAIFVWRVQIYRGKFDLVSDLITLFVNLLIIVTTCLFAIVEGLGAQISDQDTVVAKWLVNSIVINQLYAWIGLSLILVLLVIGLFAYILAEEKHEVHPASKEIRQGKLVGYYAISGAWVILSGLLGFIFGLVKWFLSSIFSLLKGILPSGETQTASVQSAESLPAE